MSIFKSLQEVIGNKTVNLAQDHEKYILFCIVQKQNKLYWKYQNFGMKFFLQKHGKLLFLFKYQSLEWDYFSKFSICKVSFLWNVLSELTSLLFGYRHTQKSAVAISTHTVQSLLSLLIYITYREFVFFFPVADTFYSV